MKFFVLVTMTGVSQCSGGAINTTYEVEVLSLEECNLMAKEYIEIPFIVSSSCKTVISD